uniref:transmembrane protein 177-like n=1 Tax=Styela clava TaxID=7725 RepID=UPI0019393DC2|nr:transmembrane protein 177-like [Styela clava]
MSSAFAHRVTKIIYNKTKRRIIAGALFSSLILKNSLKHIFPDDFFLPFYGFASPSLMQASKLLNQVKRDAGIKPGELHTTPFIARTTDVVSAGFSAFDLGQSHIGIPCSYFCDSVEEISRMDICKNKNLSRLSLSKPVVFEKIDESEVKLMKSLLLSDDAKRFAIARHLSYIQRNWAIYQALIPSAFVIVGYFTSIYSPKLLFLRGVPVSLKQILSMVFAGAFLSYILCKLTKAALSRKINQLADIDAAKISPRYAKGGVELFNKLGETNQSLRVLLGKKGEVMYTADGDVKQGLLKPFDPVGPSFTDRKKYLNDILLSFSETDHELHKNL